MGKNVCILESKFRHALDDLLQLINIKNPPHIAFKSNSGSMRAKKLLKKINFWLLIIQCKIITAILTSIKCTIIYITVKNKKKK